MTCIFSAAAENDIEIIGDYIALDNPSRALSFIGKIRARCEDIADLPEGAPLVPEFGSRIRRAVMGNYLIFYTIEGEDIVILHILHGARNVSPETFSKPNEH